MSKTLDYIFNHSYYEAVINAYALAIGAYSIPYRIWLEVQSFTYSGDYELKEYVYKHFNEIKKVNEWYQTTQKIIGQKKEAVERFFETNKIYKLGYRELKLVYNSTQEIDRIDRILKTAHDCEKQFSNAWGVFANGRDFTDIPLQELEEVKEHYFSIKSRFLKSYEQNETLYNLILGEKRHTKSSFDKDVISKEESCMMYANSVFEPVEALEHKCQLEGDELKSAILCSDVYGSYGSNSVRFADSFSISDFYDMRKQIDELGLYFDDLVKKVEDNKDSIKSFHQEKSGERKVFIQDYVAASKVGTPLYDFIEKYKDQQVARTKAKEIAKQYPKGFAALYKGVTDLGACEFSLVCEIISNEQNIRFQEQEERRKEREAAEREEKRRIEQRIAREVSSLKDCVSSWATPRCSSVPYFSLYYYYPTTCEWEANVYEWDIRNLIWNFKASPNKPQSESITKTKHEQSVSEILPLFEKVLRRYFGSNVSKLTLCCIPASTGAVTQKRYKDFSEKLCSRLGMRNGYNYIEVISNGTPRRLGGNVSACISIDTDYFNGKYVILFDDVITSGGSMETMRRNLESCGAKVIAGLSIGKTKHERHYPNPINNL